MDPQHTLWAQDGISVDTTTAGSTGVFVRFLGGHPGHHQRPGTWSSLCWHGTFTFHASLPCLELEDTPILRGVSNEHQVIRVEELPWYTSAELTRQHLQHHREEQWANDGTLMHTNYHAKLLTVLTIDSHTTPGLGVEYMLWMIRPAHSSIPWLVKAPDKTFLGTRLKAFSRSTKAKYSGFLAAMCFCCRWRTMKMASVVPLPGTKPNCISSMFTISWM